MKLYQVILKMFHCVCHYNVLSILNFDAGTFLFHFIPSKKFQATLYIELPCLHSHIKFYQSNKAFIFLAALLKTCFRLVAIDLSLGDAFSKPQCQVYDHHAATNSFATYPVVTQGRIFRYNIRFTEPETRNQKQHWLLLFHFPLIPQFLFAF